MFNRNFALEEVNSLKKAEECNAKEKRMYLGQHSSLKTEMRTKFAIQFSENEGPFGTFPKIHPFW